MGCSCEKQQFYQTAPEQNPTAKFLIKLPQKISLLKQAALTPTAWASTSAFTLKRWSPSNNKKCFAMPEDTKTQLQTHRTPRRGCAAGGGGHRRRGRRTGRPRSLSDPGVARQAGNDRSRARKFLSNELRKDSYQKFEQEIEGLLRQMSRNQQRNCRVEGRRQSISLPKYNGLGNALSDDAFEYMEIIGTGCYGSVVRVRNRMNGKYYAMKIMNKRKLKKLGPQIYQQISVERQMLNMFDHAFIVRLIFDFHTREHAFLAMELLEGRQLLKELRSHRNFSEELVRLWSAELILALEHIHSKGVVYRDLKPDNVMIDSDGHVKLIDLGIAQKLKPGEKLKDVFGGTGYKSPEMLNQTGYDYSTDWWNLGVLMYLLLTGDHPYRQFDNLDRMAAKGTAIRYPKSLSNECFDFISDLLKIYPENRIGCRKGVEEIKRHPFYSNIDWVKLLNKEVPSPFEPKLRKFHDKPQFRNAEDLITEFRRLDREQLVY